MQDRFKFRIWNGLEMHYNGFVVTATGFVAKLNALYYVGYDNEKDEEEEIQSENEFMIDNSDLDFEKDKILMQCTGLKDKNGKLIYDKDLIRYNENVFKVNINLLNMSLTNILNGDIIVVDDSKIFNDSEVIGNEFECNTKI